MTGVNDDRPAAGRAASSSGGQSGPSGPAKPGGPSGSDVPGERRLDRPPSDRYGVTVPLDPPTSTGSGARGLAFGSIAAVGGAGAIVLLGGILAVSAGLLVVAIAIGYAVAVALKAGSGTSLTGPTRSLTASALATTATIVGFLGVWLFARTEGGVLALTDYLGEVFGPIVPLHLLLAAIAAWWTAK